MASRYSAGLLTAAGSTTLPLAALVGAATIRPHIWEIGVFNTTAVAVALKLVRMTTAGTPGAAASAIATHVPEDSAPVAAVRGTYTVTATMTDAGYRCVLGAAVGAGMVWTFGDSGLVIPAATAAAVGIVVENGAGQPCQAYFVWSE
jgi:hypothetical protein